MKNETIVITMINDKMDTLRFEDHLKGTFGKELNRNFTINSYQAYDGRNPYEMISAQRKQINDLEKQVKTYQNTYDGLTKAHKLKVDGIEHKSKHDDTVIEVYRRTCDKYHKDLVKLKSANEEIANLETQIKDRDRMIEVYRNTSDRSLKALEDKVDALERNCERDEKIIDAHNRNYKQQLCRIKKLEAVARDCSKTISDLRSKTKLDALVIESLKATCEKLTNLADEKIKELRAARETIAELEEAIIFYHMTQEAMEDY